MAQSATKKNPSPRLYPRQRISSKDGFDSPLAQLAKQAARNVSTTSTLQKGISQEITYTATLFRVSRSQPRASSQPLKDPQHQHPRNQHQHSTIVHLSS
jgi:hypothetical protein